MELGEKIADIKENPVRYIKGLAMDIVVIFVGVAYVFYQMITLEPTQVNPLVLIAEAIMGIICGVMIKQALGENGFSKGYNSKTWSEEYELYNSACNTANPYMEKVGNYNLCKEIEIRRDCRRTILLGARLKYDDWFDYEGNYIGTEEALNKLERWQKHRLNKCVKIKIYVPNLFSEHSTALKEYTHKEVTDSVQKAKNLGRNTLSAVLVAIIGVYFVPMINSWSWASFISATMQVALWVIFGVLQLYTNYDFVVTTKVNLLREKKRLIKEFTTGCENGLYQNNPYDNIKRKEGIENGNVSIL